MTNLALKKNEESDLLNNHNIRLSWGENPAVQKLLDVVVSILVEEYIQVAKQNPDVFSNKGAGE